MDEIKRLFPRQKRRILPKDVLVRFSLALVFLAACNSTSEITETQYSTNQEVNDSSGIATAVQQEITNTPSPTATETQSPTSTPTETQEPVVYVDPIPFARLIEKSANVIKTMIVQDYGGGYFVKKPDSGDLGNYLFLDFSREGRLRIVENSALDNNSWGVYLERSVGAPPAAHPEGELIPWIIINQLFIENNGLGGDMEIEWGDLNVGTKIYITDSILEETLIGPGTPIPEGLFDRLFPLKDPRFVCQETDTYVDGEGTTRKFGGVACEFVGND